MRIGGGEGLGLHCFLEKGDKLCGRGKGKGPLQGGVPSRGVKQNERGVKYWRGPERRPGVVGWYTLMGSSECFLLIR